PDASLIESGASSMDIVKIAIALESQIGYRAKIEDLFRGSSIAEIAAASMRAKPEESVPGIVMDPSRREDFKKRQPGLRSDAGDCDQVRLIGSEQEGILEKKYLDRRSVRDFSDKQITLAQFSGFLSCLKQIQIDASPKYQYGSAGGLYPVQAYFYMK